jgi:hypothetical protein
MVALRQFLEFLKRSCKQCNKAHVVVATSDYSLVPMLESRRCSHFFSMNSNKDWGFCHISDDYYLFPNDCSGF